MVSFEGFEDGLTGRFFRLNAKRPLGGGLFFNGWAGASFSATSETAGSRHHCRPSRDAGSSHLSCRTRSNEIAALAGRSKG